MPGFGVISLAVISIVHASCLLVHCGDVSNQDDTEFALSAYCRSMCQWGRGGNVCNCHAAYFAGKRSTSSSTDSDGVARGRSTGVDRPSTDDDDDVWTALNAERHPPTKLPSAAAGRHGDGQLAQDDVERKWWTAIEELRRHLRSATSNSLGRWQ